MNHKRHSKCWHGLGERARQLTRNSYQVERKTGHTRNECQRKFRFRTPLILIDKVWTISTKSALSSWGFNIQVNNVIPFDSPVMMHCSKGEIAEVQRLFQLVWPRLSTVTLMAGPCFMYVLANPEAASLPMITLPQIAVSKNHLDMCRFLLQAGADPGCRDNLGMYA